MKNWYVSCHWRFEFSILKLLSLSTLQSCKSVASLYMQVVNSSDFWDGCEISTAFNLLWLLVAAFVLLWHYWISLSIWHLIMIYANSTIIACLKINHYYFHTIFPYIKATSSFSDTQPQKWQSSTLQEKQAALTFLRQCSVSKKTTCAYCVVCLNNFQEYFVLTLTLILETKPCIKVVPCIFLWILCSNLQGVVINFIVNSILR